MTDAKRLEVKDIIAAANPCNVCKPALRSTCESLGRCDTRDAWRKVERELALMEAVCEAVDARYGEHDVLDARKGAAAVLIAAHDALTAYRKEA